MKQLSENTILEEIYDETLHNIDAKILGNLFGMEVGHGKTINVGFDGRLSSESLKINSIKGLIDVGINVNEIGLCPTPLFIIHVLN